jgi:hypothetical protein
MMMVRDRAARSVATGFGEIESLKMIPDGMIPLILRWLDALQLCRAERMLSKIQLGYFYHYIPVSFQL